MAIAFDATLGTVTNNGTLVTSAAAASNSLVILCVWWFGTQTHNASYTTGGLNFSEAVEIRNSGGNDQNIAVAYAQAPSGLASSSSLTPAFSATPSFGPGIAAFSMTGLDATTPLDAVGTKKETFDETWTTNNVTTVADDTVVIGVSVTSSTTTHVATGPAAEAFGEFQVEGSQRMAGVYEIKSAQGAYSVGGVWSGTTDFEINIGLSFKAATGGEPAGVGPLQWPVSSGGGFR